MTDGTEEVIRRWLTLKVSTQTRVDAHDCPGIQVRDYWTDTSALSDVTADPVTRFTVIWECPHSDGRQTAYVSEQGTLPEVIAELEELDSRE